MGPFILFLSGLLLLPVTLFAQVTNQEILEHLTPPTDLERRLFEEDRPYQIRPRTNTVSPYDKVEIRIISVEALPKQITGVVWFINDVEQSQHRNKLSIEINAKGLGEVVSIEAHIGYFSDGKSKTHVARFGLLPIIFDLVWEGDSVVPPSYKGLPLAGLSAPVNVAAIIRFTDGFGVEYSESNFSFYWERNSFSLPERGVGASAVQIENGVDYVSAPLRVVATATLPNLGVDFSKSLNVLPINPFTLVYQFNPILGLIETSTIPRRAQSAVSSLSLSAYPLYFSKQDLINNAVDFTWVINGRESSIKNRKIDVTTEGNTSVILNVSSRNTLQQKYLQSSQYGFSIDF